MAEGLQVEEPSNPCCLTWKEKYAKLKERHSKLDEVRNALRKGLSIYEQQLSKLQAQYTSLQKAYEDEKVRSNTEKEERAKESAMRVSLENEVVVLKSEIFSLQERVDDSSKSQEVIGEVARLQELISEGAEEINRLSRLLEEERIRVESEKKRADAEMKKVGEAQKKLTAERSKAQEEKKAADAERKKADEFRVRLDIQKKEVDDLKSKLSQERCNLEDAIKKLEGERQNTKREKKGFDLEMAKVEKQKKLAEVNWKQAMDERCRADELSRQLKVSRLKVESLEKETKRLSSLTKLAPVSSDLCDKRMAAGVSEVASESVLKREAGKLQCSMSEDVNSKIEKLKEKVRREKKRLDSERRKSKEHREVAESYKEKALEEMRRADQLTQELAKYGKKLEEKDKEIQNLVSSRRFVEHSRPASDKSLNAESAEIKLLRKQLKFEKAKVKHAKQVTKLEVTRSNLLRQEFNRLKSEFSQFSQRLDMLDDSILCGYEGTHDEEKAHNLRLGSNNIFSKPHDVELHRESEPAMLDCKHSAALHWYFPFKHNSNCGDPPRHISSGNTWSRSGTDSKLESLRTSPNSNMLQSSASFSDRPLMGSQERGDFSFTTSPKLPEEMSNLIEPGKSQLSFETRKMCHRDHSTLAENSVRSPFTDNAAEKRGGNGKKRKRFLHSLEAVQNLYAKGQEWHQQVLEKLALLYDVLSVQMDKSVVKQRCVVAKQQQDICAKNVRPCKKRMVSDKVEAMPDSDVPKSRLEISTIEDSDDCWKPAPAADDQIKTTRDKMEDLVGRNQCNPDEFEELVGKDYMKLLELDNYDDEMSYRRAIEMPLSPTLPEIEYKTDELPGVEYIIPIIEEGLDRGSSDVKDICLPVCSSDVMLAEVGSSKSEPSRSCKNRTGSITNEFDKSRNLGIPSSGVENPEIICDDGIASTCNVHPKYCVAFSDDSDSSSITKVLLATSRCMAQCSLRSSRDLMVSNVLRILSQDNNISSKEKVSAFFTLLLHEVSESGAGEFGNGLDGDYILFIDSLFKQLRTVFGDEDTGRVLVNSCNLYELLALIEDFLSTGRVWVRGKSHGKSTYPSVHINLNGNSMRLVPQKASRHLLVAGAICLASVCAAVNHIGFVCEFSYSIFRMQRYDYSVGMVFLHVFARLSISKSLAFEDYGLTMAVMKSLIVYLEKTRASTGPTCFMSCVGVASGCSTLSSCPFSEGAIPMDDIVSMLFESLQNNASFLQCPLESVCLLNGPQPRITSEKMEEISADREALSTTVSEESMCLAVDILSLLELIACFMSWDWTFDNIVCRLLKMDETCVKHFSAAIFALLGQLGRFGVDNHGYEDSKVEKLRSWMSSFLTSSRTLDLSIQFACAIALLGLTSIKFEEVVGSNSEARPAVYDSAAFDCIKKWYSSLKDDHQSLFRSLQSSSGCSWIT